MCDSFYPSCRIVEAIQRPQRVRLCLASNEGATNGGNSASLIIHLPDLPLEVVHRSYERSGAEFAIGYPIQPA